jgi:CheY-like chemotaxis protein
MGSRAHKNFCAASLSATSTWQRTALVKRALGLALAFTRSRIDRHARFGRSAMQAKPSQVDYVVVADKKLEDYGALVVELSERGVRVGLFSTGEEALRAANGNAATLWVVNVMLPDMNGVALLKLVRRRLPRATVFLVGDEYSADDELTSRAAGATAYVCKPPSAAWLEVYQPQRSSPVLRQMETKHGSAATMHPP